METSPVRFELARYHSAPRSREPVAGSSAIIFLVVAYKRRIADRDIRFRPARTFPGNLVQHRIPTLDGIGIAQDRVLGRIKAIAAHPLDFANLYRDLRQFRSIGVQFNPQDAFRPDAGEAARQAQCFGVQIGAMLDILERAQGDIKVWAGLQSQLADVSGQCIFPPQLLHDRGCRISHL